MTSLVILGLGSLLLCSAAASFACRNFMPRSELRSGYCTLHAVSVLRYRSLTRCRCRGCGEASVLLYFMGRSRLWCGIEFQD